MPKLTKPFCDTVKPPIEGYEIHWDDKVAGYGLRCTASGVKAFVAQGRVKGKAVIITIGRFGLYTEDQARRKAQSLLQQMREGVDPRNVKREDEAMKVTLRQVADAFFARPGMLKDSSRDEMDRHIKTTFEKWQRHFKLLRDGELDQLPSLQWLVKRIIPDKGIGAIYGDSGTFKSFLTLDLLAHISNGQEWFGRKVKPAPAVYVPFEGQGGVPNRVKAWRLAQAKLLNPDALMIASPPDDVQSNVAVIIDAMNLRLAPDRDKLVATLTECGWAGGVLCIDTLAHASNGIDENSSEMGEMIGIFRDLQLRLGGVILLVHHSGKDQSRGMRGWSGLHAAMDFVIECRRDKEARAMEAEFALTKVKDGSDGEFFNFAMESIVLGFDEDGEGITSLVTV